MKESCKKTEYAIYYIANMDEMRRASFVLVFDSFEKASKKMHWLEVRESNGEIAYLDDVRRIAEGSRDSYQKEMDVRFKYEF